MKWPAVATIIIVAVCVIAGIVVANTDSKQETPIVTPTVAPTPIPTPTPHPDIYYIPNEQRTHADKYPIGTKIGEEISPAFTPSPK